MNTSLNALQTSLCALAFALMCWVGATNASEPIDLTVETEADYLALLDGVRAAEYVRQRYMENDGAPRALLTAAALWVFAETNPLATTEQLSEFAAQYDVLLAHAVPGDPDLTRYGSVHTALSQRHVVINATLEGMDTRVGDRVSALLGMALPGIVNYAQARMRMTRFDLASVQRLIHRRETADMLTSVLSGRTPNGERRVLLAETAAAYLSMQGLAPMLGQVDPSQTEINSGLEGLPSYAEFLELKDSSSQLESLKDAVLASIELIQDQGDAILSGMGLHSAELGQFSSALELTVAASDPNALGHVDALAELNAIRAAIVERVRETAAQRASIFARTLLMQQASFDEIQAAAVTTRSFAALQLQTNNQLAIMQETAGLAGSLIGVGMGIIREDPWEAVQSLTNVVTSALGLGSLLGDQGPSAEQQIFDQIVELRQQLEDMRVQLNERFDIVDQKLDAVFSQMTDGFLELGDQIGDLQESVDTLAASIAEARSGLERIEQALYGFIEGGLLLNLSAHTNLVLNYRQNSGVDLPYTQGNPDFVSSASFFYNFATETAESPLFAGTAEGQTLAVTLDNAASILLPGTPGAAFARYLNDLRRIPPGLQAPEGHTVSGPLTNGRVAAPAPWAQAASAFLQLCRESPWYFNYMLASQGAGSDLAWINQIIRDGDDIVALANATRDRYELFDALLHRARQQVDSAQSAINAVIDAETGLSNGTVRVDPWGSLGQTVSPLSPAITQIRWYSAEVTTPLLGTWNINGNNFPRRGHEISVANSHIFQPPVPPSTSRGEKAERNAMTYLLNVGATTTPRVDMYMLNRVMNSTHPRITMWLCSDRRAIYGTCRRIVFHKEYYANNQWRLISSAPSTIPAWTVGDSINRAWSSISSELVLGNLEGRTYTTGNLFFPFPFSYATRLRVTTDYSTSVYGVTWVVNPVDEWLPQQNYLTDQLATLRDNSRANMLDQLDQQGSGLDQAGGNLDNTSVLLDAYLSLGMGDALTQSEILRSAFRGMPSIAGMGFRSDDLLALIIHDLINDDGSVGGGSGLSLTALNDVLHARINGLAIEIDEALGSDAPSFPYVEMVLAELRALRDQAARLAIGETFEVVGTLVIPPAQGLLRNDISQLGVVGESLLEVDQAFFQMPEAIQPAHGQLSVAEDGSFSYVPDPGFTGVDRFSYRLAARLSAINGIPLDAFSAPTVVVLRVVDTGISDPIFSNGFE